MLWAKNPKHKHSAESLKELSVFYYTVTQHQSSLKFCHYFRHQQKISQFWKYTENVLRSEVNAIILGKNTK